MGNSVGIGELRITNKKELELKLKKVNKSIEYLIQAGILKIPEDIAWATIEKRKEIAFVNSMELG
jgi:hypothetical protein